MVVSAANAAPSLEPGGRQDRHRRQRARLHGDRYRSRRGRHADLHARQRHRCPRAPRSPPAAPSPGRPRPPRSEPTPSTCASPTAMLSDCETIDVVVSAANAAPNLEPGGRQDRHRRHRARLHGDRYRSRRGRHPDLHARQRHRGARGRLDHLRRRLHLDAHGRPGRNPHLRRVRLRRRALRLRDDRRGRVRGQRRPRPRPGGRQDRHRRHASSPSRRPLPIPTRATP